MFLRGALNPNFKHGKCCKKTERERTGAPRGGNQQAAQLIASLETSLTRHLSELSKHGCSVASLNSMRKASYTLRRALNTAWKRERRSSAERLRLAMKRDAMQHAREEKAGLATTAQLRKVPHLFPRPNHRYAVIFRWTAHCKTVHVKNTARTTKARARRSKVEQVFGKSAGFDSHTHLQWANKSMNISCAISATKVAELAGYAAHERTGLIAHVETFAKQEDAQSWLRQLAAAPYAFPGPSSGDIRCIIMSPHAVRMAEVVDIDDEARDAAVACELQLYFAKFGPKIFAALKRDHKTLNQKGSAGRAALLALEKGWAGVMKAANAARAKAVLGLV
jgi:hypothetical protein